MKYNLSYLSEKIKTAPLINEPFKHIYIENFFSDEHFNEIVKSKEIDVEQSNNPTELIDRLEGLGYATIRFPGCITDKNKYLNWLDSDVVAQEAAEGINTTCEGFGMVYRLMKLKSEILSDINEYICSKEFNEVIAERYDIDLKECTIDAGIQKYLNKYEISPHPDIRRKASTFMVNINPGEGCEEIDYHTHYLKFKPEWEFVQEYWEDNSNKDRCWVPWDWAEVIKTQTKNNSIVIFSPGNDTLHGVKVSYDHLTTQRTQLYGNIWYKETNVDPIGQTPNWKDYLRGRDLGWV